MARTEPGRPQPSVLFPAGALVPGAVSLQKGCQVADDADITDGTTEALIEMSLLYILTEDLTLYTNTC